MEVFIYDLLQPYVGEYAGIFSWHSNFISSFQLSEDASNYK